MKVTNLNGTTRNTCNCGSWLKHWEKFSGRSLPAFCCEVNCSQKPEVGAHVQKSGASDNNWYIIPLCQRHNAMSGATLDIRDYTTLVSASVKETCGK